MKTSQKEALFNSEVVTKFELFNSLFLTLPFYKIKHTGTLLPFFTTHCEEGIKGNISPNDIIESFFGQYEQYIQAADRFDLLFRFIQYIERQVVLFDAIEDSAFTKINTREQNGSILGLLHANPELKEAIRGKLQDFSLRMVLTAHPTQFYPGPVLAIINDLVDALKANNIGEVNLLLQQLGKTPFFKKVKPTPVNEAVSLAWFLENVFYHVITEIHRELEDEFEAPIFNNHQLVEMGFWPGGDRDGNPNVTKDGTREVSLMLREILFRCYYRDFKHLKRRITFRGVEEYMEKLQNLFYDNSFKKPEHLENLQPEIIALLESIKDVLLMSHDGLFIDKVDDLIRKVRLFGCYFASLDIRQDSRILRKAHEEGRMAANCGLPTNYNELSEAEKLNILSFNQADITITEGTDLTLDTYKTIREIKKMQEAGGEKACHRFIISNCQEATDILQLVNLFLWSGWNKDELSIDFVPLFETVDDLIAAGEIMDILYTHPFYKSHLARRGNKQIIMLGFSDSTKDGGYLMANWSIYKAKVELTSIARKYGIQLAFFDGRGGPPARGGGKTHRFYSSMGTEIANDHIQLTIQGQTISSQYGSFESAHFNLDQLINAGVASAVDGIESHTLNEQQKSMFSELANTSHEAFVKLRQDPLFLKYLEQYSPLKLLSEINISSRPVKRNTGAELKLEDLRAISFVTAWTQLKQNIPGFYGVGTALLRAKQSEKWEEVKELYQNSGQFRTIMDNCGMSMSKADFRITSYMASNPVFGNFWKTLKSEFDLTRDLMLELTGNSVLMEAYPLDRKSIAIREKIILPLVIIQHYALQQLEKSSHDEETIRILKKLIIRTVYGIVNAGRNVA